MTDREFINKLINNYFSHSIDAHQATFHNAITNRLNEIADKLDKYKEYKNIEEQLGCPLDVLDKALKNGIYSNLGFTDKITHYEVITNGKFLFATPVELFDEVWALVEYKKRWWLKEDRSE